MSNEILAVIWIVAMPLVIWFIGWGPAGIPEDPRDWPGY
jgi:hypothetical protein